MKTVYEISPFGTSSNNKEHIILKLCLHNNYKNVINSNIITLHKNKDEVLFLLGDTGDLRNDTQLALINHPNIKHNDPRARFVWSFDETMNIEQIKDFIHSIGKNFYDLTYIDPNYIIHNNEIIHKNNIVCMEEQHKPSFFSVGLHQRNNRAHYTQLMSDI
tara:strand:- start:71 stop:553 length:483 start_codon:yes stop_codon:yes gene_type:complete